MEYKSNINPLDNRLRPQSQVLQLVTDCQQLQLSGMSCASSTTHTLTLPSFNSLPLAPCV